MKPPKDGSSKRIVWDVFKKDGADAALAMQGRVPVGDSTVRSWVAEWARNAGTPLPKAAPAAPKAAAKGKGKTTKGADKASAAIPRERIKKPQVERERLPFDPHFKHSSRRAAELQIEGIASRSGIDPKAFHVLEDKGRYAVAPLTHKPPMPIPQFKKGDIVYDLIIPNTKAQIVEAGPEQCVIKYLGKPKGKLVRPEQEAVPNVYLYKFEEDKTSKSKKAGNGKRERL